MKQHGEDKRPDKKPRLHQVTTHTTHSFYGIHSAHSSKIHILTHQQAAQALPGLVVLPSTLARLLLSFLPGRAIPSLLGVSHTARRLCACLYDLVLSSCKELDDVRFVSSLVRLRTLDLSGCSVQLVDVSPLSLLTSLNALYLGVDDDQYSQLVDVSPFSALVALETLHVVGFENIIAYD